MRGHVHPSEFSEEVRLGALEPNSQVRCEESHRFHRVLVPGGSRECWVWGWEGHPEPQRGVVAPVVRPGQDGAPVCVPVRHRSAWGPGQQGSGLPAHRTGSPLRTVSRQSHLLWPEGWLALPTVSWKESHLSGSICPQPPRLLSCGSQSDPGDSEPLSAQECALPPAGSAGGTERGPGEVI